MFGNPSECPVNRSLICHQIYFLINVYKIFLQLTRVAINFLLYQTISKTVETILKKKKKKKNGRNHGISVYKKALISEH